MRDQKESKSTGWINSIDVREIYKAKLRSVYTRQLCGAPSPSPAQKCLSRRFGQPSRTRPRGRRSFRGYLMLAHGKFGRI